MFCIGKAESRWQNLPHLNILFSKRTSALRVSYQESKLGNMAHSRATCWCMPSYFHLPLLLSVSSWSWFYKSYHWNKLGILPLSSTDTKLSMWLSNWKRVWLYFRGFSVPVQMARGFGWRLKAIYLKDFLQIRPYTNSWTCKSKALMFEKYIFLMKMLPNLLLNACERLNTRKHSSMPETMEGILQWVSARFLAKLCKSSLILILIISVEGFCWTKNCGCVKSVHWGLWGGQNKQPG